ncbi:MAG: site-specific tyrosine recombinase XerC [Gammaproteobacteria bacterium]|nr:site-specific tyrosine recombinase XerC [Gammaproteobacteria bacterium]
MALRKKRNTRVANQARQTISESLIHNGFYSYYRAFLRDTETTCSQDTIKRRESALRRFIVWCGERDLQQPQNITKPILERYKRHLYYYRKSNGDPLSTGSQHTLLTPLKTFFRYLAKENHILYNPASELDIPKKPKRLPKAILHQDEINDVLNTIDITTVSGVRDRAMIETLYSTGMRRMELVNLTIYDIDHRRGAIWIREGKYQKDRFVPIGDNALSWIVTYQEQARSDLVMEPDKGILFLTDYGEAFKRDALSNLVKRYLTRAGITTLGSCHLFRHACATHMLENGADIRFIQQLLGHEDLNTTQIYTQVSIDKLKAIHQATHPSDRAPVQDDENQ